MYTKDDFGKFLKKVGYAATVGALLRSLIPEERKPIPNPTLTTEVVPQLPKYDVDLNIYEGFPYTNEDIAKLEKITVGHPIPPSLEGIIDLDGRDHLFYVELKDGKKALVKPYKSNTEKEVLAKLRDSGISLCYVSQDTSNGYFVEEVPTLPTIETALKSGSTFLYKVSGLLGEALYLMLSRDINDNGRFNNRIFVDDIGKKVKVSNFSNATITSSPAHLRGGIIRAFSYIESLAAEYKVGETDFLRAIKSFSLGYLVDRDGGYLVDRDGGIKVKEAQNVFKFEDGKKIFRDAVEYILSNESPGSLIVTALSKLTK